MSWLAILEVDAEFIHSAGISRDIYTWHKMLWQCYPNAPDRTRTDIGFLTRIDQLEGAYRFWIMAREKPARPPWCPSEGFAVKEISSAFLSHGQYAFDLKVNPVKAKVQREGGKPLYKANGKRKSGKRVPLTKKEELMQWLFRKAEKGGFRIADTECLEISPMVESHFRKKDKTYNKEYAAYHGGVQFRGILEVTDQRSFEETYYAGVGSAKGFGFGLLLLAPINL